MHYLSVVDMYCMKWQRDVRVTVLLNVGKSSSSRHRTRDGDVVRLMPQRLQLLHGYYSSVLDVRDETGLKEPIVRDKSNGRGGTTSVGVLNGDSEICLSS
jgi:hypothetical protein